MRCLLCLMGMIAAGTGCQELPLASPLPIKPRLANRAAVAKALPNGLKLDLVVEADGWSQKDGHDQYYHPIVLEEELAKVGARVGEDGKLRDTSGKEIYFYHLPFEGIPQGESVYQSRADAYRKLQQQYCVIDIDDHPGCLAP